LIVLMIDVRSGKLPERSIIRKTISCY